jgi:lipopolysaccharide export system protein LptC
MSQAANRERQVRKQWAVPGSRHDRLIRFARVALPSAVGVFVVLLAVAPFGKDSEVSFILDKNEVENAPERMRVEKARYVGENGNGQKFSLVANSAIQRTSNVPIVDISGMTAQMMLEQGLLTINADKARYNIDEQRVAIDGAVRVVGPDDYRLSTSDVLVNLKERNVISQGRVSGEMSLGRFEAGHLRADLDQRKVVLDGGARLKIVQGAVR